MKKIVGSLLIGIGLTLYILGIYFVWERTNPNRLSFSYTKPTVSTNKKHPQPVRITINSIHVDLPMYLSAIHDNSWETTTKGVSYLDSSPYPGDVGNSILYGHNWTNLLGNLVSIKPGDHISITYDDHMTKDFTVMYTSVVSPTNIHILAPSHDKRVTIYTCTGLFDSQRFVAVALLN